MADSRFAVEKFVIISSKTRMDMLQWRRYLVANWARLMPARTRLLVLAGIHGCQDGRWGAGRTPRRTASSRTPENK
jgi:hypothetical protein